VGGRLVCDPAFRSQTAAWDRSGGLKALGHFRDPRIAWRVPVGPVWRYWALTGVAFLLAVVVAGAMWRIWRSAQDTISRRHDKPHARLPGLGNRAHVLEHAGEERLAAQGTQIRPGLARLSPAHLGHRIGRSHGRDVWTSVED
jgi:hypothetical protein